MPFAHNPSHRLACLAVAASLAACGGGDDTATTTTTTTTTASGGASVAAAPLVITAGNPTSLNGTLGIVGAQFESNSSTETLGNFAEADPYCRVAAYTLTNSGDGKKYFVELSFRKDTRAIGLLKFGSDSPLATLARVAAPVTGVTIDIANRRVGFVNVVVTSTGTAVTLNGALDYPTNIAPANRAACG